MSRRDFLSKATLAGAAATVATAGGVLPVVPPAAATTSGRKVTLRLSHSHAPDPVQSNLHMNALRLQELVSKKTDNQMEIQIFPANQLGEERAVVEGIKMGTIDLMSSGISIWSNLAPKVGLFDLPFVFPNFARIKEVVTGPVGAELTQHVRQVTGAQVLGFLPSYGFRDVATKSKEVKRVEDLKGLKVRVLPAPVFIRTFELLGATPVPMAFGEVYVGIQTGVVDGWEHDAPTTVASKIYEVTKFFARTEHIHSVCCITANSKKIDSLPSDLQNALMDAVKEACSYTFDLAPQKEEEGFKVLVTKGMTINPFDKAPAIAKVKGYWQEYAEKVKATDILAKMVG
jgi:tripartite ATP-independent transporter DctP family solute receptor